MQLGIFAKTFQRPALEEVFQAVASHGLAVVQFNFACAGLPSLPDAIEAAVLERIRRATTRHQVSIAAVSGTFNMIHPDPQERHDGLRRLGVVAAASARLGASVLTLCTGTRDPENMWRAHPDNSAPESWQALTASIAEALTIAESHQLILGIEPEINNVVDSARQARRLLDEMKSPRLKIILDPANLFTPGHPAAWRSTLEEAFDWLGGDIVLAHAKELDQAGHAGNLPLGAGGLDWDDYLSRLGDAGFAGPLIMHGFEERDVSASAAFLKQKLDSTKLLRARGENSPKQSSRFEPLNQGTSTGLKQP